MSKKYDVVIKSTGMGSGEQELSDNLMKFHGSVKFFV